MTSDVSPLPLSSSAAARCASFRASSKPRKENIYNKYYQVEYLGNIKNQHVGWLNIPIERMKELTRESININYPQLVMKVIDQS